MIELLELFRMTMFTLMSPKLTPHKGFKGLKLVRFVLRFLF